MQVRKGLSQRWQSVLAVIGKARRHGRECQRILVVAVAVRGEKKRTDAAEAAVRHVHSGSDDFMSGSTKLRQRNVRLLTDRRLSYR